MPQSDSLTTEEAQAAVATLQSAINLAWSDDVRVAALDVQPEVVPCQLVAALAGLQQLIAERFLDVSEDSEDSVEG